MTNTDTTSRHRVFKESDRDYVTMVWRGYHDSATFRAGTEHMLDELRRHGSGKVLADIESMVMIGMDDQEWLLSDFLPRAIEHGFSAIAIVKPVSYFNKVAVETIAYKVNQEKLRIRMFDSADKAREWLSAC